MIFLLICFKKNYFVWRYCSIIFVCITWKAIATLFSQIECFKIGNVFTAKKSYLSAKNCVNWCIFSIFINLTDFYQHVITHITSSKGTILSELNCIANLIISSFCCITFMTVRIPTETQIYCLPTTKQYILTGCRLIFLKTEKPFWLVLYRATFDTHS